MLIVEDFGVVAFEAVITEEAIHRQYTLRDGAVVVELLLVGLVVEVVVGDLCGV